MRFRPFSPGTPPSRRVVLRLEGAIDICSTSHWSAHAQRLLGGLPAVVVVDMAQVTFLDTTGVALLLELRAHPADPAVWVVNMPAMATKVLTICGLNQTHGILAIPAWTAPAREGFSA